MQKPTQPYAFMHGDEQPDAGIAKNSRLTARILLDLSTLHRRINRHRDRSRVQHPEECSEKIETRGQHECDAVAGHDVALNQPDCEGARSFCQLSVAQPSKDSGVVLQHGDVKTLGMLGSMPLQNLQQRACLACR